MGEDEVEVTVEVEKRHDRRDEIAHRRQVDVVRLKGTDKRRALALLTPELDRAAAGIAGLLLAAIMAASISTADSQLLVASSSFTSDLYQPLIRKNASDREVLWVGRIAVVVISVVAYFIASSKGAGAQALMNMVENAWGIFGAAFGPVILRSLFWRRFNYTGACVGVVVGAVVDIVWLMCLSSTGIYEIVPGFICGMIAAVVATLATKAPSKEVTDIFDMASAPGFGE